MFDACAKLTAGTAALAICLHAACWCGLRCVHASAHHLRLCIAPAHECCMQADCQPEAELSSRHVMMCGSLLQHTLGSCTAHQYCLQGMPHLHSMDQLLLGVKHKLDTAMRPAPQLLDDKVLVHKDVALQQRAVPSCRELLCPSR